MNHDASRPGRSRLGEDQPTEDTGRPGPGAASPGGSQPELLPPGDLALLVHDALATVDPRPPSDMPAAILYGWATGAISSRQLSLRAETDLGLRFLLGGATADFREVRAYREARAADLERTYARALLVCRAAGLLRIGALALDGSPGPRPAEADDGPDADLRALARHLLARAARADEQEDQEVGPDARGDELPPQLATVEQRRTVFAQVRASTARARAPGAAERAWLLREGWRVSATVVVLVGALLLVRWIGEIVASDGAPSRPQLAPLFELPPALASQAGEEEDIDFQAAAEQAHALALDALERDDLESARILYLLALEAVPTDSLAAERITQVGTVLGLETRRGDWDEAVEELGALRAAAPASAAVLRAYVTALVQAGRAALRGGELSRAAELCGEAVRWFPARGDAQACAESVRLAAAPPTPLPTPQPTAPAPPTPSSPAPAAGQPSVPTAAAPGGGAPAASSLGAPSPTSVEASATAAFPTVTQPTPSAVPTEPAPERAALRVFLSGSCQPAASGSGGTVRVGGSVSAGGVPQEGVHVVLEVVNPQGTDTTLLDSVVTGQSFAVTHSLGQGTYTFRARATRDGFEPGQGSLAVTC